MNDWMIGFFLFTSLTWPALLMWAVSERDTRKFWEREATRRDR